MQYEKLMSNYLSALFPKGCLLTYQTFKSICIAILFYFTSLFIRSAAHDNRQTFNEKSSSQKIKKENRIISIANLQQQ